MLWGAYSSYSGGWGFIAGTAHLVDAELVMSHWNNPRMLVRVYDLSNGELVAERAPAGWPAGAIPA